MDDLTEVFEIVDRHTGRRYMEVIYLTADQAMNAVAGWPKSTQASARVQSVRVATSP